MKEYEILTRSLKDSAANSKLKLLKQGETFGVEKPGGEKRIHIGSMSEEKEWDRFFFPNGGKTFNVIVSKIDLIKYMIEAKNEYLNPQQSYRLRISDFYDNLYEQTLRIPQESFEICFEKNTDSRYYLTRPSTNNLSKNYNYIIDICLPIVTKYVFLRVKDKKTYVFYLKPEYRPDFNTPNLIEKASNCGINLQQIYYGAPGTGKSHEINRLTEGEEVIRTTFHPDSDYSTFVGCYKPHMDEVDMTTIIGKDLIVVKDESGQPKKEKRIVYKYSCQAFLQAYIAAWQHPDKAQYLVIEEINRGNCAQIFGDIFQLLDRNDEGYSAYPIKTDADAENELRTLFAIDWNLTEEKAKEVDDLYRKHYPDGITKSIKDGSILLLPSNLYIWATMNTSDQSLFPIDSAFKRRWDWKYMKIAEGRDSETKKPLNWVVKFDYEEDGKPYTFECKWWDFIMTINDKIATATSSDDKKLGYFFCKPKTQGSKEIDAERFVGKVVFYLWNDVFKDEDNAIFKVIEGNGEPSFDAFYTENEEGKTVADTVILRKFMHNVFREQSELYTETAKKTTDTAETVTE